jgi:hypothetical protein
MPRQTVHLIDDCQRSIRALRSTSLLLVADEVTRLSLPIERASLSFMEFYIGYLKAAAPKYWWLQGPEHPVLARHNNEQIVTFYCLYCAFEAATVD